MGGTEPPSILLCHGLIRVTKFTGFPASFAESLWLVFFIIPMEKQAINFPTMHDHAVKSELSHGHFKFSWNDDTKYGKRLKNTGSLY